MKRAAGVWGVLLAMALAGVAGASPFGVSAAWKAGATNVVAVSLTIPAEHYVYADRFSITSAPPAGLTTVARPAAKRKFDTYSEATVEVYDHDVTFEYAVSGAKGEPVSLAVALQGCNASLCFLPERRALTLAGGGATEPPPPAPPAGAVAAPRADTAGFTLAGRAAGYMKPDAFLAFLDGATSGTSADGDLLSTALRRRGLWFAVLLILAGGLGLNLTPCVLPMIPVNIAIIGAGSHAGSRVRGFALGAVYGAAIAVVYGALGLVVVLTGAKFGTLNASPWFNATIAAIFVVLALAMFDVFHIDLSRFQAGGPAARRGGFVAAALFGAIAALLAGACVAPVVISVLLLAAGFYARGQPAGLLLPFLLGLGMALPWPFAGAGLSFLPKPGRWMERVKYAFGFIILMAATWYGVLALSLFRDRSAESREAVVRAQAAGAAAGWHTSLDEGLAAAAATGQPVFVDFWASWCKSCLHMEKTTFLDARVRARLDGFVRVKVRAEDPGEPATRELLDRYGAIGLPTYVVLTPAAAAAPSSGTHDGQR